MNNNFGFFLKHDIKEWVARLATESPATSHWLATPISCEENLSEGGCVTPDFLELYKSQRWKYTRWDIIRRDGGSCTVCDVKYNLHVHHKSYTGNHPSDSPDSELITLCKDCHRRAHHIPYRPDTGGFVSVGEVLRELYSAE